MIADKPRTLTVGELIDALQSYPQYTPIVIEAAGIGTDDRTAIHEISMAMYEGMEEVHIVAR